MSRINMEAQFDAFLASIGLILLPSEYRSSAVRAAFMAGYGRAIMVMARQISEMEDEEATEAIQAILSQVRDEMTRYVEEVTK